MSQPEYLNMPNFLRNKENLATEKKEKIMKKIIGYVSYAVRVDCPHCSKLLQLNEYPYTDEEQDYAPYEDLLGMELFGGPNNPAKWNNFQIEYKCCGCKKKFVITELET